MVEVKKDRFETLENNILLKNLTEYDKKVIDSAFEEKLPIFYMNKNRFDSLGLELKLEKVESNDNYIFVNPLCRKDIFDGKIDSIKELLKNNFNYLNHMFRYNSTLKEFSELLEKGHYEVMKQYKSNDVWNYIKENHYSYTEKTGKYIGHMETKSKLDFFPTSYKIQYISLALLMSLSFNNLDFIKKSTIKLMDEIMGESFARIISNKSWRWIDVYAKLISIERYDLINEVFKVKMYNEYSDNRKLVVADLFAGEGEWLNLFKNITVNKKRIYTLANEIEKNRFLSCKEKKFDKVIWGAYEELKDKVPKQLIDICLFNPPYGETDGIRNVTRFIKMLTKDKYLDKRARTVIVINELDLLSNKQLIAENFEICCIFSLNDRESERLKQYCLIGKFYPTSLNHYSSRVDRIDRELRDHTRHLETEDDLIELLNLYGEYSDYNYIDSKLVNVYYDKLKFDLNPNMYKSNYESVGWKQLIQNFQVETFKGKIVKLAEKPKNLGAAANLISSGLINGEIKGEHEHCIAAGISEQTFKQYDYESGNIIVKKQSMPFLSVLTGGNIVNISRKPQDNVEISDDGTVVVV